MSRAAAAPQQRQLRRRLLVTACAVILQLQSVLLQPGASTFITNVSVNDIPSGWLQPNENNSHHTAPPTPASVVMNLLHAKKASVSNIWSPTRRVKLQNTIKTVQVATLRPRLVAQRIVQSRPVASLEDFSEELQTDSSVTPSVAETSGLWALLSSHRTTTKMADEQTDPKVSVEEDDSEVTNSEVSTTTSTTEAPIIDHDIDLLQLIDELPDIDSTSVELELATDPTATETDAPSTATTAANLRDDDLMDADDDDDDDPFRSSESVEETIDTLVKAKRAIGNEQLVPKGNIVRPALLAKPKKTSAPSLMSDMLPKETSAERAERVQKGIQRLMHFITIVGHVDSYLTKRFRTGVKKMARLYESTEDAHRRPPAPRRRRRISF